MIKFKKENGLPVGEFEGLPIVAVCTGVEIGMGDTNEIFSEGVAVARAQIQTSLKFINSGRVLYQSGYNIICQVSELPNVRHFNDDRSGFSDEFIAWYTDKVVEMTNPVVEEITE